MKAALIDVARAHHAPRVEGKAIARVAGDIELAELLDQIRERIVFADEAAGRAERRLTPRRIVRAIFRLVRARRDRGLSPYPASLVHAAVWLLVSDDER